MKISKTIELVNIEKLTPYARNSRTHSDAQVAQIAGSIKEFGFTNPVLIDADSGVIAGHGRILAARALGINELPCIRIDYLSDTQKRALVIADNRLALNAGWDDDLLALELGDLKDLGVDLALTGFGDEELAALLAEDGTSGLTDPDDTPEPPEAPITAPGDVWIMGKHRIVCGDSTDALVVEKSLNGISPHLMVTDPPYGVEYDADWRNKAVRSDGSASDGRAVGKVMNDDRADWREAWALFPGDVAYVWHAGLFAGVVAESLEACGFVLRSQIIWGKTRFAIGRGDYHWQHEPCWYAVKKGGKGHGSGDRTQSTLWTIQHQKSETGHSTQKPVECMRRPLENNSSHGQAVYEPFSGSGTTIIACEQTGRACHAVELNPAYVDVAIIRWQNFTGQAAIHEETGRTFSDLSGERTQ